jgi:hypothetical protein
MWRREVETITGRGSYESFFHRTNWVAYFGSRPDDGVLSEF